MMMLAAKTLIGIEDTTALVIALICFALAGLGIWWERRQRRSSDAESELPQRSDRKELVFNRDDRRTILGCFLALMAPPVFWVFMAIASRIASALHQ